MDDELVNPSHRVPTGNLCKDMKSEHVERLKEEYHKAHSTCLEKIEQWNKFKQDYEVLKRKLETLPDQISYDIMVPFGPHAFMPGKLTHTNEVLTLLGANWFAEVSAKHAAEISTRRIKQCEKMLEDLNKEKEQYENWLKYISEVTGGDLEIVEHWNEEKLDQWREQHSKNVKAYKQRQAEMNTSSSKEKEIPKDAPVEKNSCSAESDKDYFQILDDLEEQEVTDDDMNESLSSEADDDDEDVDDLDNDSEGSDQKENDGDSLDDQLKHNEKHVKWKDQEGEKMKNCITFTHSSRKCKSHSKPIAISKGKSKHKESVPLSPVKIQSPSDIYKCFSTKPDQSKPKSILKRTTSVDEAEMLTEVIAQPASHNSGDVPVLQTRFKEQTAFTGEIVEHEMDKVSLGDKPENTAQRAPSRFKAQRQNKHR